MKHTKGPWKIKTQPTGLESPDDCDDIFVINDQGFHIACVWNPDAQFMQHGPVVNARLIAAAPSLLEALERTLSCIDQHTDDDCLGPIILQAQAAIKKAKGE